MAEPSTPGAFAEVTNTVLSPPESQKVTRRSRSRRSNRTRSTSFNSPSGEVPACTDAPRLAGRLQAHVDTAAAVRLGTAELRDLLGTLSHDALRERVEQLAAQAALLHTELHSEWRCLLLSTANGGAACAAALPRLSGPANGGEALDRPASLEPPPPQPSAHAAEPAPAHAPPQQQVGSAPLQPAHVLEPVAELDTAGGHAGADAGRAEEESDYRTRGGEGGSAAASAAAAPQAAAAAGPATGAASLPGTPRQPARDVVAGFARPPPISVPPHAPPCTPPALHSAPLASTAGPRASSGVRPATLSGCAGGPHGLGGAAAGGGFGFGAGGSLRSPFVPLTISASAVRRARASASVHAPAPVRPFAASFGGAGCGTPSVAQTPRRRPPAPSGDSAARASSAARAIAGAAAGGGASDGARASVLPWGRSHAAAAHVQARMRGWLGRRRWRAALRRLVERAAVAAELVASEARYRQSLTLLVEAFLRPLEAAGAAGERASAAIFANARVLVNVSSLFLCALAPAALDLNPARAVAAALQAHVPLFKTYLPYVASLSRAQGALARAREHAGLGAILREAEARAGCTLDSLLIQPIQRVPRYRLLVERLLQLTAPGAAEYAQLQEVMLRVSELCAAVNESAAEAQSCAKVAALAKELGVDEKSSLLPGGLAQPHRRFVREGVLLELPAAAGSAGGMAGVAEGGAAPAGGGAGAWAAAVSAAAAAGGGAGGSGRTVRLIMCNDVLLIATQGLLGRYSVRDALSLGKARVRALAGPAQEGASVADGARHAFELCVGRKAHVFAAPSADEKHAWVKALSKQVHALLSRFKARGRSLAFLPQNVAMLRQQLAAAERERAAVETQVCQISEELCGLEAQVRADRQRRDAAEREVGSTEEASSERLAALLQAVFEADLAISRAEARRALLQAQIGHHVARLSQISEMLELTAAKHDSDSLLQFMLFSNQ